MADKNYEGEKKRLLIKEISVLVIFAVIIAASLLFLFPVATKNIFFLNPGAKAGLSEFYPGNSSKTVFEGPGLLPLNDAGINNFSNIGKAIKGGNYLELFPSDAISTGTGDYLKISMAARNNESVDFPEGSINIKWKYENQPDYEPINQETMKIYIDGFLHEYLAPLSESENWKQGEKISSILIEVPDVSGVKINISKVSFNKRSIPSLDFFINRFFKEKFSIREINRFLTPSYFGLLFILAMVYSLKLVSRRVMTGKLMFTASVIILFIFSAYFFKNELLTVKSYYDSYRLNIHRADFKNTYLGFYDFEKFISWAAGKIPENENLVVFIRGDQVYIKSELAYNLYPRDIKFINISNVTPEVINKEIMSINMEAKKQGINAYRYIIALSLEDAINSGSLALQYSYKPDAGLIYLLK